MLDDKVVSARKLVKNYGQFEAVRGVDFDIVAGEIFGLIGPDGAGKTSIFHILGGVMDKSGGEVLVLGESPRLARSGIGYLTQKFSLYLDLSVRENIRYMGGLRQVPEIEFKQRSEKYLRLMDLYRFGDRLAGQLSGGMKQKLALCCALIARPNLLLLDEPTTGVDPVSRRDFWDILSQISEEGVTVAVATPYLDEAERCHRVALMHEGEIEQIGTPAELKASLNLKRLEVRATGSKLWQIQDLLEKQMQQQAKTEPGNIRDVQPFGDHFDLLTDNPDLARQIVENTAKSVDAAVTCTKLEPSLENVFVVRLEESTKKVENIPFPYSPDFVKLKGSAIGAKKVSKFFGDFQAVKQVSLTVNFGEIFGLLGANGAGKTTTIKILCGLLEASAGEMMLSGAKSDLRNPNLRKDIGYMSQKFTLYEDLTVLENLQFYSGVYDVPEDLRQKRIDWVIQTCDLVGKENLLTKQLPGGWKQRLAFAASVIHQPKILFLDEPTSGVDPLARRQLWNLIRSFANSGTAILITTHYLEEAEYCQQLAFMNAGEIVASGSPSEIKSSQKGALMELETSDLKLASDLLKTIFDKWRVSIFADKIHLVVDQPEVDMARARETLSQNNIQIISERTIPFSLEDVFIGIVQRAQRQNGALAA